MTTHVRCDKGDGQQWEFQVRCVCFSFLRKKKSSALDTSMLLLREQGKESEKERVRESERVQEREKSEKGRQELEKGKEREEKIDVTTCSP